VTWLLTQNNDDRHRPLQRAHELSLSYTLMMNADARAADGPD